MTLWTSSVFSTARMGMVPASMPISTAAAFTSSSMRALKPGSTQARATMRMPSAGLLESMTSIMRRNSSAPMISFSMSNSATASVKAMDSV